MTNHSRMRWAATLACAILLAGCGPEAPVTGDGNNMGTSSPSPVPSPTPSPAPSPSPTPPGGTAMYTLTVAPLPLATSVTADSTRAVTQTVVATAGGTLTATGADGTVYTLTVPNNALSNDLTITMTPVASFASLPFNGSDTSAAWGVQLEPAGSQFLNPLTLRITPPAGTSLPISQQLPFSWGDGGANVALAMTDPASAAIDLKLMHFSGWAIARHQLGVSASLSGLRDRLGGDVSARLESAMAERLDALRQQQQTGSADAGLLSDPELQALLTQYDQQVIQPRVAAAGQSCANFRLAEETLATAARGRQLLGLNDPYTATMTDLLVPGATVCMKEEYTKCHDNHIVQDIIPAALGMDRQAQLLGIDTRADWVAWRTAADQQIMQCHVYRLDFDSTGSQSKSGKPGWNFSERMKGSVTMRFNGPPIEDKSSKVVGDGVLTSMGYQMSFNDPCKSLTSTSPANGSLSVWGLAVTAAKDGSIADFRMTYMPGLNFSTLVWTYTCAVPPYSTSEFAFTWSAVYIADVFSDPAYFNSTDGGFVDHWTVNQGSATIATKSIAPQFISGSETNNAPTSFTLVHTPGM